MTITKLGYAFFRLVPIRSHDPGEPPFQPVRTAARKRMAAFVTLR